MRMDEGEVGAWIPGHGWYHVTPQTMDLMISRHFPARVSELRVKVQEVSREIGHEADVSDVRTVTELLFILAELQGYGLD